MVSRSVLEEILAVVPAGEENAVSNSYIADVLDGKYALQTISRNLKGADGVGTKLVTIHHIKVRLFWRKA